MKKLTLYFAFCMLLLTTSATLSEPVEINIMHLNDTHSNLLPGKGRDENAKAHYGGIARAASVIGAAKMQDPETLLLHSGDFFIGDLMWYTSGYGALELGILNELGLNALTIGNHEFDGTSELLAGVLSYASESFPNISFLSTNIQPLDEKPYGMAIKSFIKDYIIKEVKGVKIGIFGMTSPVANLTSLPGPDCAVDDNILMYAETIVGDLKAEGCDVIIFLSHLGRPLDQYIASSVDGIHLIIGGHDHISTEEIINNTKIVQCQPFYHSVGSVNMIVDGENVSINSMEIPLTSDIPEYEGVTMLLEGVLEELGEARALFEMPVAYATKFHTEYVATPMEEGEWGTDVGCLIATAFKEWGNTDIGFTTSGLSAQPLYQGPIVPNDICRMLGYGVNATSGVGYNMARFKLKGIDLWMGLQFCVSYVKENGDDEFLPQLGGSKIVYYTEKGTLLSVEINGQPIDFEKDYSLSTSLFVYELLSFVYDTLGYSEPPMFDVIIDNEISDFQVVLNYVISLQTLTPVDGCPGCITAPVQDNLSKFKAFNLTTYPNPTNGMLNIQSEEVLFGDVQIEIFNYLGNKVAEFTEIADNTNTISINLLGIAEGAYIIRLKNNGVKQSGKVIIGK